MKGVNKCIFIGTLGRDPETRFLPTGGAVTNFSIAINESWKDKQTGERQERTEWVRIVAFGKLAEIAGEYLRKGSKVYVEGSLITRKYQANDGSDRYVTEIKVSEMQMLDGRQDAAGSAGSSGGYGGSASEPPAAPASGYGAPAGDFGDDVPF